MFSALKDKRGNNQYQESNIEIFHFVLFVLLTKTNNTFE